MTDADRQPLRERNRQFARDVVLDAAERLLHKDGAADFSMRALAAEAGVGFATPFNHFGSKNAIMQALSSRVIDRMASRFSAEIHDGDSIDRVLAMARISVAVLLEQPDVYKTVVGSLGVAGPAPTAVRAQAQALWSLALGDFAGIAEETEGLARAVFAEQLAFSFRGCLSFWIAGEIDDGALEPAFTVGACAILLGFAVTERRQFLMERIRKAASVRQAAVAPRIE